MCTLSITDSGEPEWTFGVWGEGYMGGHLRISHHCQTQLTGNCGAGCQGSAHAVSTLRGEYILMYSCGAITGIRICVFRLVYPVYNMNMNMHKSKMNAFTT